MQRLQRHLPHLICGDSGDLHFFERLGDVSTDYDTKLVFCDTSDDLTVTVTIVVPHACSASN